MLRAEKHNKIILISNKKGTIVICGNSGMKRVHIISKRRMGKDQKELLWRQSPQKVKKAKFYFEKFFFVKRKKFIQGLSAEVPKNMKWDKTFFYVKWRIKSHHDMRYQQHIHHARWLWRHVKKVVTFFKTRKFFPIIFISWIFLAIWKFLSIFFLLSKNCSCQLFFLLSFCRFHSP